MDDSVLDEIDELDVPEMSEIVNKDEQKTPFTICLLYTSPSPRDRQKSRMPSSA